MDKVADRFERDGADAWFASSDGASCSAPEHAALRQGQRHRRRLVRVGRVVGGGVRGRALGRARLVDGRRSPADRSLPRRLGSAPRLVPLVAARLVRHARPRALSRGAHARLRPRRKGAPLLEVGHRAARAAGEKVEYIPPEERHQAAGRRAVAHVDRAGRLPQRHHVFARAPDAARRVVSQAAQHHALPPRQPVRLRSDAGPGQRGARRSARSLPLRSRRRPRGARQARLRRLRAAHRLARARRLLHRSICRRSISTCARIASTAIPRPRPSGAPRRRVLYRCLRVVTTALAPICCFTAEEVWSHMPKLGPYDPDSVHLVLLGTGKPQAEDEIATMGQLLELRARVQKELEPFRAQKKSSLDAHVTVTVPAELAQLIGTHASGVARRPADRLAAPPCKLGCGRRHRRRRGQGQSLRALLEMDRRPAAAVRSLPGRRRRTRSCVMPPAKYRWFAFVFALSLALDQGSQGVGAPRLAPDLPRRQDDHPRLLRSALLRRTRARRSACSAACRARAISCSSSASARSSSSPPICARRRPTRGGSAPSWASSPAARSATSSIASSTARVTDFIVWKAAGHEWPTFNIADAALVVGVIGLLFDMRPDESQT